MEEFYPMPLFVTIEVNDIIASLEWYEHALGFRIIYVKSLGTDVKPSLAHLRRNRYQDRHNVQQLALTEASGRQTIRRHSTLDESVEHSVRPAICQSIVVLIRTHRIGVSGESERNLGVLDQEASNEVEVRLVVLLDHSLVEAELLN